jgi:trehalose 6-phosphate phosphatase
MSGEMTLEEALVPIVADPSRSALLLDVDGTLAPIVRDPEDASVSELFRRLLVDCTATYALVGCVSGRQASEARRIVGMGSIPYAGNHGLELLVRGSREAQVNPEAERWMTQVHGVVARQDQAEIGDVGLRVEDKGTIVGLHWRGVDDEVAARAVAERIAEEASEEGLHLHRGRNVIEARSRRCSTGSAPPGRYMQATTAPTSMPSPACASWSTPGSWRERYAWACSPTRRLPSCSSGPTWSSTARRASASCSPSSPGPEP